MGSTVVLADGGGLLFLRGACGTRWFRIFSMVITDSGGGEDGRARGIKGGMAKCNFSCRTSARRGKRSSGISGTKQQAGVLGRRWEVFSRQGLNRLLSLSLWWLGRTKASLVAKNVAIIWREFCRIPIYNSPQSNTLVALDEGDFLDKYFEISVFSFVTRSLR